MATNVIRNSLCLSDPKGKYGNCREILAELGIRNATDQDCENVRYVCSVVSRRAAHLASAGIASLLIKMGENNVTVGVDGSVYRFHPHFHDLMVEKISTLQQYKVRGPPINPFYLV
jgi:hexokinase